MNRKDYILIAGAIADAARLSAITTGDEKLASIAHNAYAQTMAHALSQTNPRFDKARFLVACGVSQ